jgi:acyl carrier protein
MTPDDLRALMLKALGDIAPEADLANVPPRADLREELDIDSMDFLRYVTALSKALNVPIPESAYADLFTLEGGVEYLARELGPS